MFLGGNYLVHRNRGGTAAMRKALNVKYDLWQISPKKKKIGQVTYPNFIKNYKGEKGYVIVDKGIACRKELWEAKSEDFPHDYFQQFP